MIISLLTHSTLFLLTFLILLLRLTLINFVFAPFGAPYLPRRSQRKPVKERLNVFFSYRVNKQQFINTLNTGWLTFLLPTPSCLNPAHNALQSDEGCSPLSISGYFGFLKHCASCTEHKVIKRNKLPDRSMSSVWMTWCRCANVACWRRRPPISDKQKFKLCTTLIGLLQQLVTWQFAHGNRRVEGKRSRHSLTTKSVGQADCQNIIRAGVLSLDCLSFSNKGFK